MHRCFFLVAVSRRKEFALACETQRLANLPRRNLILSCTEGFVTSPITVFSYLSQLYDDRLERPLFAHPEPILLYASLVLRNTCVRINAKIEKYALAVAGRQSIWQFE